MIFDPALAAAARRHARAQAKSQKPTAEASSSSSSQSTGVAGVPTSADNRRSDSNGSSSNSNADAAAKSKRPQDASASGEGGVSAATPGTAAVAPSDSSEHERTMASAATAFVRRGERAGSSNSSLGGDLGGVPGVLGRTASASANGGDLEGAMRVGHVTSRSRTMKPRVLLKIVVLGCSNVGKTSLMKRYAANDFTEMRRPTIGADFMTKEIVAGDQPMLLQVWDTAGQERFHGGSLGSGFFRGANAALLVYDVACAVSFEQVAMWREELLVRLDVDPHDFPIVVIGNKVDLSKGLPMDGVHGVDKTRVLKWCEMQGMGHIETSAKDGTGVEVAMQAVAMLALDQKRKRDRDLALNPSLGGGTTLDLADERARQQRTGGCCWL